MVLVIGPGPGLSPVYLPNVNSSNMNLIRNEFNDPHQAVPILAMDQESNNSLASIMAMHGGALKNCRILHDTYSVAIQGILLFICFGIFCLKWRAESNRRPILIFGMDSSKQAIGSGLLHILNMLCAVVFQKLMPNQISDQGSTDECGWYWINIMVDTTIGILVSYVVLKKFEKHYEFESGNYRKSHVSQSEYESLTDWHDINKAIDWSKYRIQLIAWLVTVSAMKFAMILVMASGATIWAYLANLVLNWIDDVKMKLLFVMVFTPCVMNVFQFISIDTFLRFYGSEKNTDATTSDITSITKGNTDSNSKYTKFDYDNDVDDSIEIEEKTKLKQSTSPDSEFFGPESGKTENVNFSKK